MWLLNTETLLLEHFMGAAPPYAILSHRWEEHQEVGFGNVKEGACSHLKGHQKILDFCKEARQAKYTYGWVDTCCIDKSSSAELSEAINSMYAWYKDAKACFAYLADLESLDELESSSWFKRGWTLQELIAPSEVRFYNKEWKVLGTKQELSTSLEKITGIPEKALSATFRTDDYCIADKMSWSAKRHTSRKEDRAYCLLGLFDISMPMLYGEGDRAFQRLQEEIMKTSKDASLFFWQGRPADNFGMLAYDPSCFSGVQSLSPNDDSDQSPFTSGWTLSNAGITIPNVVVKPYALAQPGSPIYVLPMNAFSPARHDVANAAPLFGILLEKDNEKDGLSTYRRVAVNGRVSVHKISQYLEVCTERQSVQISRSPLLERRVSMEGQLRLDIRAGNGWTLHSYVRPEDDLRPHDMLITWRHTANQCWDDGQYNCFSIPSQHFHGLLAYVILRLDGSDSIVVFLCLGYDFQPYSIVVPYAENLNPGRFSERNIFRAYDILIKRRNHHSHHRNNHRSFFDRETLVMFSVDDGLSSLYTVPVGLKDNPHCDGRPLVFANFPECADDVGMQDGDSLMFTFKLDCDDFFRLMRPYRPSEYCRKTSLTRLAKHYKEHRNDGPFRLFPQAPYIRQRYNMFYWGVGYTNPALPQYNTPVRLFFYCRRAFRLLVLRRGYSYRPVNM